jgi:subtilase family protein
MRPQRRRTDVFRTARFESVEPRIVLSANPTGDLCAGQFVQSSISNPFATATLDGHDLTGLTEALSNYDFTGEGQTVVVIDSGVAYDHAALGGGIGEGYTVVGGWDFTEENDADPYDDGPFGSHGTHVAGVIASNDTNYPGIAPGADIVALRVFNDAGQTQLSWVEDALEWVHENRDSFANPITTVNLSMGLFTNSMTPPDGAVLEDELAQLAADGIFITAAAGNGYTRFEEPGLSYPASSPYVTAVGSVDSTGELSYFTQRHTSMLAAPGRSVTSTVPDYIGNRNGIDDDFAQYSGTSMASPYVAGAAVLVREAYAFAGYTDVSAQTIYETLYESADRVYDSATETTYRRLNIDSAIESVLPGDDYGSTASSAHQIGRISGDVTLSGSITTLADCDYFTFTAAASGQVEVAVSSTDRLDADLTVLSNSVQPGADGTLTFDVVAGQDYTLALKTADGLGHYTLDIATASSAPVVAEPVAPEPVATTPTAPETELPAPVVVEQVELTNQSISSTGQVYGFTAANSGIFTVEALFQHSRGDVDLELVDSAGQRLATSTSNTNNERIDVTVSAGETVYVRATTSGGLTNSDVDLRVTNLVTQQGSNLVVRGTSGADEFRFVADSVVRVAINGVDYEMSGDSITSVRFDGQAGSDTAFLYGTHESDSAALRVGSADLSGSGYSASVTNTESIEILGRGGSDVASITDSAGDDRFTASPDYAAMTGTGFSLIAKQFEIVHAYARNGGDDEASLSDSAGNDMFVATPEYGKMIGDGTMVRAKLFESVHAYARSGGTDRARITGSSSADVVTSTPSYTRLVTSGASIRTKFFDEVDVRGHGGYDRAYLRDSTGNDTLVTQPGITTLSGTGYSNTLRSFTQVIATAAAGGVDTAVFYDSAGADAFFADSTEARMSGSGYDNRARGFDRITARASGGYDQATLYDSALNDHFAATGDRAQMQNSALVTWVYDFDRVRAVSDSGGHDTAELDAVDYILQVSGPWDRE